MSNYTRTSIWNIQTYPNGCSYNIQHYYLYLYNIYIYIYVYSFWFMQIIRIPAAWRLYTSHTYTHEFQILFCKVLPGSFLCSPMNCGSLTYLPYQLTYVINSLGHWLKSSQIYNKIPMISHVSWLNSHVWWLDHHLPTLWAPGSLRCWEDHQSGLHVEGRCRFLPLMDFPWKKQY